MVEKPSHCYALLQANGEDVPPFVFGVPVTGAVEDVGDVDGVEPFFKVGVCDAFRAHLAQGVGVDDLLAERATGEVGSLGDVEDVRVGGFFDGATVDGPETAEDAEEGGFAAAIGADDEEVVGGL